MEIKQSPNKTTPIKPRRINYIIIHSMAGYYQGSIAWFMNPKSQVSAHYLISQKGEITQMVKDTDIAWHCHGINANSIGIELEDMLKADTDPAWITSELYLTLTNLTSVLSKKYNIPVENIYTHCDPYIQKINGKSFTHSDPGKFFNLVKFRHDVTKCTK